jgi:hypothetical protein
VIGSRLLSSVARSRDRDHCGNTIESLPRTCGLYTGRERMGMRSAWLFWVLCICVTPPLIQLPPLQRRKGNFFRCGSVRCTAACQRSPTATMPTYLTVQNLHGCVALPFVKDHPLQPLDSCGYRRAVPHRHAVRTSIHGLNVGGCGGRSCCESFGNYRSISMSKTQALSVPPANERSTPGTSQASPPPRPVRRDTAVIR